VPACRDASSLPMFRAGARVFLVLMWNTCCRGVPWEHRVGARPRGRRRFTRRRTRLRTPTRV